MYCILYCNNIVYELDLRARVYYTSYYRYIKMILMRLDLGLQRRRPFVHNNNNNVEGLCISVHFIYEPFDISTYLLLLLLLVLYVAIRNSLLECIIL